MGTLSYAGATSHVGKIARDPHATPDFSAGLHAAWRTMQDELYQQQVDALVVVGTDHYETFGLQNYPSFCIGASDSYEAWGSSETRPARSPGTPNSPSLCWRAWWRAGSICPARTRCD